MLRSRGRTLRSSCSLNSFSTKIFRRSPVTPLPVPPQPSRFFSFSSVRKTASKKSLPSSATLKSTPLHVSPGKTVTVELPASKPKVNQKMRYNFRSFTQFTLAESWSNVNGALGSKRHGCCCSWCNWRRSYHRTGIHTKCASCNEELYPMHHYSTCIFSKFIVANLIPKLGVMGMVAADFKVGFYSSIWI